MFTPVGKKRFRRVVVANGAAWDISGGALVAEFLPIDMGSPRELMSEEQIVGQLKDNEIATNRACEDEERIALRALRSRSRSATSARASHTKAKAQG